MQIGHILIKDHWPGELITHEKIQILPIIIHLFSYNVMQQKIQFVRQFKTKYSCFAKINFEK
jgi:hypothetical protein